MNRRLAIGLSALVVAAGCSRSPARSIDAGPPAALSSCPVGNGFYALYDGTDPSDLARLVAAQPNFVVMGTGLESRGDLAAPFQAGGVRALLTIDTDGSTRIIDSNIETALKAGWDGVFFDHILPSAHAYNSELANRVHGGGINKLVVMNPAEASVDPDLFEHADIVSSQQHFEDALSPTGMPPWRWLAAENGAMTANDAIARLNSYRALGGFWYFSPAGVLPDWFEDFATRARALDPPCGPSSTLNVSALDLDNGGAPLSGLEILISQNQTEVTHGFTPLSLLLPNGSYLVAAENFGNDVFDHWDDDGTAPAHALDLTADVTLKVYYHTTPQTATLSVGAYEIAGNSAITGAPIVVQKSGATVTQGMSPFSMVLPLDVYQVVVNDFGSYVFDHWDDTSITRERDLAFGTATTLNAFYRAAGTSPSPTPSPTPTPSPSPGSTVTVTVNTVDMSGTPITGLFVTEFDAGGNTLGTGYSYMNATFTVSIGVSYVIDPANFKTDMFANWSDGNTTKRRSFVFTTDTTLVAVYND